jgi:hypothetical protein
MAHNGQRPNRLAVAVGFGIGLAWIAMALFTLARAKTGFGYSRPDYGLAWSLAGVLLLAAGVSAVIGTWWHVLRAHPENH